MFKKILLFFILLAELHLAIYATFMAFLVNVWMESDSFALFATELDWWLKAAKSFALTTFAALIITAIIYYIGYMLLRRGMIKRTQYPLYSALLVFTAMTLAGLGGAIMFVIEKPYL